MKLTPNGENIDYEAEPNDAYSYVEKETTFQKALELVNLADITNISMGELEDGSPQVICELIDSALILVMHRNVLVP